jgi:purine catabolism regulator
MRRIVPATVRRLLRQSSLGLTLVGGESLDDAIQWIHGSDLADPTPFLSDGQMLLTTGTQFPESSTQADYDAYVSRLSARGVVALGFGTEVVRSGTPPELAAACQSVGMPLLEVPYLTPFIAIIRWSADLIARESRARDDWSLAAQRAISVAALSQGGLAGVLVALAEQLEGKVALLDSGGSIVEAVSPSHFDVGERAELEREALRLLGRGSRSAGSILVGGARASLQTLGRRDQLRGVLAVVGGTELDSAAQAVLTSAVALAEVALEQEVSGRGSLMPLNSELLALLLEGEVELVGRVVRLPAAPVVVALCRWRPSEWELQRAVPLGFFAPLGDDTVVILSASDWNPGALGSVAAVIGASQSLGYDQLDAAVTQAGRSLAIAEQRGVAVIEFDDVREGDFLGILTPELVSAAAARLATVDPELLRYASAWLAHNCAWDPAARELGIHRHSLKARMDEVGIALGLLLDTFAGRAELWALLAAREGSAGAPREE